MENAQPKKEKRRKFRDFIRSFSRNYLLLALIITFIVLSVPLFNVFIDKNLLIGEEPYYHIRLSNYILNNDIHIKDSLVYGDRNLFFNPFHPMLALFSLIMPSGYAYQLLLLSFALLIVFFIFRICEHFRIEQKKAFFILLLLISSPLFIYLSTVSASNAMALALGLAAFHLFMKEDYYAQKFSKTKQNTIKYASYALFLASSLFSIFNALLVAITLLSYSTTAKDKQKRIVALSAICVIIPALLGVKFFYNFNYSMLKAGFSANLVSDFGSLIGFSLISLMFAFIGFVDSWKDSKKIRYLHILLILFFALSWLYSPFINIYLNFIISFFAGIGLYRLVNMRWSLYFIKRMSLLTIFCILFFSTVSYIQLTKDFSPEKDSVSALIFFDFMKKKNENMQQEMFLTDVNRAFLIQAITNQPVLADPLSAAMPGFKFIYSDLEKILHSEDLKEAVELLNKYNVTYILIDKRMKQAFLKEEKRDIIFMLTNNETFKNEYRVGNSEIWRFIANGTS